MSKTFIIGDPHFWHKNIIRLCNRPFNSVEEMNKALINNWNNTVSMEDDVIVAGDFALCSKEKLIEIGKVLNGRKTLILGNHDEKAAEVYFEAGFKYVIPHTIIVEEFFIISHTPMFVAPDGVFANIFAHVHNNPEYTDASARSFCVSAERINYTPIDFAAIKAKMREIDERN